MIDDSSINDKSILTILHAFYFALMNIFITYSYREDMLMEVVYPHNVIISGSEVLIVHPVIAIPTYGIREGDMW